MLLIYALEDVQFAAFLSIHPTEKKSFLFSFLIFKNTCG